MKLKILILKLLGVLLMSCSVAHLQTSDTGYYPPTNAEYIEVYSTEKASRPYTEIGQVYASTEAFDDGKESVKYLKKEAAKLGADGIINLRLEIGNGVIGNSVAAYGTAVKYR